MLLLPIATLPVQKNRRVLAFLESYSKDIRALGIRLTIHETSRTIEARTKRSSIGQEQLAARLYFNSLKKNLATIRAFEAKNAALLDFASVTSLNVSAIRPEVVVCSTPERLGLYEYLLRFQSVPVNPSVGASVRAIVYDVGQQGTPNIMGVLTLSSARYFQGARDAYLEWPNPKEDERGKYLRVAGLRRCLHLSVCMAIPPYDALRGGRMVALLAFCGTMQNAYRERYGERYIAVTATAALRNYAVLYSRISRKAVLPASGSGLVFTKLQNVRPRYRYAFQALSQRTWDEAHAIADAASDRGIASDWGESRERVLRRALRRCGLSIEMLRTNETATYFGALDPAYADHLRCGDEPKQVLALEGDAVLNYWRERHMTGALGRLSQGGVEDGRRVSERFATMKSRA